MELVSSKQEEVAGFVCIHDVCFYLREWRLSVECFSLEAGWHEEFFRSASFYLSDRNCLWNHFAVAINHAPTFWGSAWRIAFTLMVYFLSGRIIYPLSFRTDKFETCKTSFCFEVPSGFISFIRRMLSLGQQGRLHLW